MLAHICDMHEGGELKLGKVVSVGIDEQALELDLCQSCEEKLRGALAPFVEAARTPVAAKSNGHAARPATPRPAATARPAVAAPSPAAVPTMQLNKDQRAAIRRWAAENGHRVSVRGTIAQTVVNDYFNMAGVH